MSSFRVPKQIPRKQDNHWMCLNIWHTSIQSVKNLIQPLQAPLWSSKLNWSYSSDYVLVVLVNTESILYHTLLIVGLIKYSDPYLLVKTLDAKPYLSGLSRTLVVSVLP